MSVTYLHESQGRHPRFTTCAQCETVLNKSPQAPVEDRTACPYCGSMTRCYKVHIQETIRTKSDLGLKAHHESNRKPFLEQKSGDSLYRKAQKWVHRIMRVDRDNNLYSELVIDPETQEVIHHCEESLSEHQNHGSAKKRTSTDNQPE